MGILILALVGFGIYWLVKRDRKCFDSSSKNKNKALETLNERFVNGEIDEETYKKMKEVLKG